MKTESKSYVRIKDAGFGLIQKLAVTIQGPTHNGGVFAARRNRTGDCTNSSAQEYPTGKSRGEMDASTAVDPRKPSCRRFQPVPRLFIWIGMRIVAIHFRKPKGRISLALICIDEFLNGGGL